MSDILESINNLSPKHKLLYIIEHKGNCPHLTCRECPLYIQYSTYEHTHCNALKLLSAGAPTEVKASAKYDQAIATYLKEHGTKADLVRIIL